MDDDDCEKRSCGVNEEARKGLAGGPESEAGRQKSGHGREGVADGEGDPSEGRDMKGERREGKGDKKKVEEGPEIASGIKETAEPENIREREG